MRTCPLKLIVLIASTTLTASCAHSVPRFAPVDPPRRQMPATATASCVLALLPAGASRFDLEQAFNNRGADLVACDVARQLAVDVHQAEHVDLDAWLASLERGGKP